MLPGVPFDKRESLKNSVTKSQVFNRQIKTRQESRYDIKKILPLFHQALPFLTLPAIAQQPPSIRIAFTFTSASVTFLQAEATMRENVERDIFISLAASLCFFPSRHASRIASNSSTLNTTPSSLFNGLHLGRKHRSPGKHLTHLVFFGLTQRSSYYAHWFITNLIMPGFSVNGIFL
jgi:hypothetical protein